MRRATALLALLAACGASPRDSVDAGEADASGPDAAVDVLGTTYLYANSSYALYRIDPDTLEITKVADFSSPGGVEPIYDIAIDSHGMIVGVSISTVYRIDPVNARLTALNTGIREELTGLSFVPAAMVGRTGADVLVGTRSADGLVFLIDLTTGQGGPIGDTGDFRGIADLVSVTGAGTRMVARGLVTGSSQRLVELAEPGLSGTTVGPSAGVTGVVGLAYWKNRLLGFVYPGEIVEIDQTTGKPTVVQTGGPDWFGAAVTTSAPIH